MKIIPINDKIIIKLINEDNKNKNILIPEQKEKSNEGLIISISEDINFYKTKIKLGDKVIFNKFSGQNIKINNENYLIIRKEDILAILI